MGGMGQADAQDAGIVKAAEFTLSTAVDAEAEGKRVALVIGNQAYADSPLCNP